VSVGGRMYVMSLTTKMRTLSRVHSPLPVHKLNGRRFSIPP
jgi:hypothetical protein